MDEKPDNRVGVKAATIQSQGALAAAKLTAKAHWKTGIAVALIGLLGILVNSLISNPTPSINQTVKDTAQGVLVTGDNATVNINKMDETAQQAIAALTKQLENQQLSLVEKESLIRSLTETINELVKAKQEETLPTAAVEQALQDIIANGDTTKAKALLTKQIDANQDAIEQQARWHEQRGALSFATDTHAALADYVRATQLNPGSMNAWNRSGQLYRRLGQLDKALECYSRVLELGKQNQYIHAVAAALANIGIVYHILGDLDKALEMQQQSLNLTEKLGNKGGMANNFDNIGIVYVDRGDLDKALAMHQQALVLNERLGRKEGMANNLGNIGNVHRVRGDLDKALEMYQQALALHEEIGRTEGMAYSLGNIGNVHYQRDDLVNAKALWEQSLVLFKEIGAQRQIELVQGWLDSVPKGVDVTE